MSKKKELSEELLPEQSQEQQSRRADNRSQFQIWEEYLEENYEFRLNEVSMNIEIRRRGDDNFEKSDDILLNSIWRDMKRRRYGITISDIRNLLYSDFSLKYNPFQEYLDLLPQWDGADYFKELEGYLNLEKTADYQFSLYFKKWFCRMVRCMIDENYYNKQMVLIIGEGHNAGKSYFCRWLCPPILKKYMSEELGEGRDGLIQLTANLFIFLDELDQHPKDTMGRLKSIMSKPNINVRLFFGKTQSFLYRRVSFIATTNKTNILEDETGSIRYICFKNLAPINYKGYLKMGIDNLYAQAYYLVKSKAFNYEMTRDEEMVLQNYNRQFFNNSKEMDLVIQYIGKGQQTGYNTYYWNAAQIMTYLQYNFQGLRLHEVPFGKSLYFLGFDKCKTTFKKLKVYEIHLLDSSLTIPLILLNRTKINNTDS